MQCVVCEPNDGKESMADRSDLNLADLEEENVVSSEDDEEEMFDEPETVITARELEPVFDIPVTVSAVLGMSTMLVSQMLKLGRGAVIELDRKVGEAIDIYVNNRLAARGEVIIVDEKLGVTMTEIIKSDKPAGNIV
jgi:flagellar motor switch protein FliN/FliY